MGLLQTIIPAISGSHGMFTNLQHALWQAHERRVHLLYAVQDELSAWRQLVQELSDRPTHLREIDPFLLTREGVTYASGSGMGASDKTWKASGLSVATYFMQRCKP